MTVAVSPSELILKRIKELPPLPVVVNKLIRIMESDRSSAEDVKEVLSSDQAMAGKVLKLVNSSFYGLSGEVSTISRAVVILGFAAIRNLATGLGVAGAMAMAGKGGPQQEFWEHAIAVASGCEVLARQTGYPDPEEAFIAGLLHDIGHLILARALPGEFAACRALGPQDMLENELKMLGMGHTKAGQTLLKHWKLPVRLQNAVRFHHNLKVATGGEQPLTALVALADALASVQGSTYESSLQQDGFLSLVGASGLDTRETAGLLEALDAKVQDTRRFLRIATDEDLGAAERTDFPPLKAVMICTDAVKAAWTTGALEYFGHAMIPMGEFFAGSPVDVVILDPPSITAEQMLKIKPVILKHRDRTAVFGAGDRPVDVPGLDLTLPSLPLAFSQADLASLAG
ncbi:MAG: HDOD domain-containing protein [Candidatus Krumholzibacteriia bacterium]